MHLFDKLFQAGLGEIAANKGLQQWTDTYTEGPFVPDLFLLPTQTCQRRGNSDKKERRGGVKGGVISGKEYSLSFLPKSLLASTDGRKKNQY